MDSRETANAFLRIFLHILFKRKFFIITFFSATALMAGIYATKIDPIYTASSQILVKLGREHFFVPTSTNEAFTPTISFSSREQINSEIELIKSRPLIEKVVDAIGPTVIYEDLAEKNPGILKPFELRLRQFFKQILNRDQQQTQASIYGKPLVLSKSDRAVLGVQRGLTVQGVRDSRVIEISFKHKDPQIAARVTEALVSAYLEIRSHVYKNPESYSFFEGQSKILKARINRLEEELKSFKKEHNIISLEEERTIVLSKKADLQSTLNESLSEKVETEKRIGEISQQLEATPSKIQQGESTDLNPYLISSLEERLVSLEIKERELLAKYTENNHMVQDVRKQLKIVRDRLAEQEKKRYGSARFGPNPTYQRLKEDLFRNEAELKAINAKIQSQRGHLAEYSTRLDELNQFEHKLNDLQNQLAVDQKNFQLYLTKHEESRIHSEMDSKKIANISVIKPAQPPLKPTGNKAVLILAIGLIAAVFGSVGMAIFLEYLSEDLERPEDIENLLGAPVLTSIPKHRS
ncbi:MAG: GumC family protein [Desulfobacterales bacterium]|nr:MAG: GumC family protein [Desulfobacterales bacterium]